MIDVMICVRHSCVMHEVTARDGSCTIHICPECRAEITTWGNAHAVADQHAQEVEQIEGSAFRAIEKKLAH